jgi:hypothetical protein
MNKKPKTLLDLQRAKIELTPLERHWLLRILNKTMRPGHNDGWRILRKGKFVKGRVFELTTRGQQALKQVEASREKSKTEQQPDPES